MPDFTYRSAREPRPKGLETLVLGGLAFMVSFLILSFFHPEFRTVLAGDPRIFPVVLVFMYLLFLLPSRRLFRHQRTAQTRLSTTRRGFTFHDPQGEKVMSWRDVKQARIIVDVNRNHEAYPSKFILVHSKGRIALENDPPIYELQGNESLLRQIMKRVPNVVFRFHWFHRICPFCKSALTPRGKGCPGCSRSVEYVPKLLRPWELVREEGIYLVLILLVLGSRFQGIALLYIATVMLLPWLWNLRGTLVPLPVDRQEDEAAEDGGDEAEAPASPKAPRAVVALLGWAALLAMAAADPAVADPAASPTARPVPSPHASPSPPVQDADWFPLGVGYRWEYESNYNRVVVRVIGRDAVNGVPCYVVETTVGSATASSQVEYVTVTPQGVQVLKRTHKGSDFILKVPETMLSFPVVPGRRWTWEGDGDTGQVLLAFSIRNRVDLSIPGKTVPAVLVVLHGRSADGSELQTKRWYSPGIGLVRELTLMKKGTKALKVDATLVDFQREPRGALPTPNQDFACLRPI